MEKFIISDLQTKDPVILKYKSPTLVLFFSLKEIIMIKEINKDISHSKLSAVSIYIGEDEKKVHLWRQKESDCMPAYYGGNDLADWSFYKISEIPWVLLISNNEIIFSSSLSSINKPFLKSILHKFPQFKQKKNQNTDGIDKIVVSKNLTTEEKINALETISTQGQAEIKQLKKELEAKDKIIRDILHKLEIYSGNRSNRKRLMPIDESFNSKEIENFKNEAIEQSLEINRNPSLEKNNEDDEGLLPKDLWIYSIVNVKPQLPAISQISRKSNFQKKIRSKSSNLKNGKEKSK